MISRFHTRTKKNNAVRTRSDPTVRGPGAVHVGRAEPRAGRAKPRAGRAKPRAGRVEPRAVF